MVSGLALYFAFRNVPFNQLCIYLGSMNYFWILPSVAVNTVSFILRVVRWQILLRPDYKISFWEAFHPLLIGFTLNFILPGRAGEAARPLILRQQSKVPFPTGLATVAAERLLDVIILLGLLIFVLSKIEIDPDLDIVFAGQHLNRATLETIAQGMFKISILLISGVIMVAFTHTRSWFTKVITVLPQLFTHRPGFKLKLENRVCQPLVRFVDDFAKGLTVIRTPKILVICLLSSLVIWIITGYSYYVMLLGAPGIKLTFTEVMAVMVIICFFIALPSVPGFWGLWEAGGVFAMSLFGIPESNAAGFTLVNHGIQFFPVIVMGCLSAWYLGGNIMRFSNKKYDQ